MSILRRIVHAHERPRWCRVQRMWCAPMIAHPKPIKTPKVKRIPAAKRRKKLVAQLDKIVSLYVRERDGKCVTCGSIAHLQCGHLITRAHYAVRWDLWNTHCQCSRCNLLHEYNPHIYTSWFIDRFGLPEYRALLARDVPRKIGEEEMSNILESVTLFYDKLQSRAVFEEPHTMYREA